MECNLKKSVPKAFREFCQHAVSSDLHVDTTPTAAADHVHTHSLEQGHSYTAAVIATPYADISDQMIQVLQSEYPGADLAIVQTEVLLKRLSCTFLTSENLVLYLNAHTEHKEHSRYCLCRQGGQCCYRQIIVQCNTSLSLFFSLNWTLSGKTPLQGCATTPSSL